jgi:hypothetical protein
MKEKNTGSNGPLVNRLNDSRGDLRGMNLPCSIALKIGSPVGLIFGNTAGSSLSPTYFHGVRCGVT